MSPDHATPCQMHAQCGATQWKLLSRAIIWIETYTNKKPCFSLLVGRPKKIQVWTALVLNKAPRAPIPSGHRFAADLRIVHGGWVTIRLIALFSAGRRLLCHPAFWGFCATVTKGPRTLFADRRRHLDAICQPRVQTPASFNSFQTDERFFEGPLSGFSVQMAPHL